MKKIVFLLLIVLSFTGSVFAQGGLSKDQIGQIATSVVQIIAYDNGDPIGSGSGTIVEPTGLIFTNHHVVEDADDFAILMTGDLREMPELRYYASVVGVAEDMDFAVLQIDRDEDERPLDPEDLDLPIVPLGKTDIGHGDRVYIFGFPGIGDGYLVLTQGTITTIENGTVGGERLPVWYQTDAEISPGNSGGLVVNETGEFIGIPTAVQTEERTLGRLGGILPMTAISALLDADELTSSSQANSNSRERRRSTQSAGVHVDCDDGVSFDNGVEVTIHQIRAGYNYTASVIGVNGFDPILAVLDKNGQGLCTDDEPAAADFEADLPTSGTVSAAETSSQIVFSQTSGEAFADVSLVVGGFENAGGEFILLIEGLAATRADNLGDIFSVKLTPGMIASEVPVTVYMISQTNDLDPYLYLPDEDGNVVELDNGDQMFCDDAGSRDCWGDSEDLSDSYVSQTNGRLLAGGEYDAMLSLPIEGFELEDDEDFAFTFITTSYEQTTSGDYIVAFHLGTQ